MMIRNNPQTCALQLYLVCCCLAVSFFAVGVGAVRIRGHADYTRLRTDLERLVDGLRTQEIVTRDTLPELPHHFNQTDHPETDVLYLQAVKQVVKLKAMLTNQVEETDSEESEEEDHIQTVLDKVVEDACGWLSTVLPPDFNCTSEQLENLYARIDFHHVVQDARIAVRNFHQQTGDPTSSFGPPTDCSWVNLRLLGGCNNSSASLSCQQEVVKDFFTVENGHCDSESLRPEFTLCQDH